jgi:hypothetical protein
MLEREEVLLVTGCVRSFLRLAGNWRGGGMKGKERKGKERKGAVADIE